MTHFPHKNSLNSTKRRRRFVLATRTALSLGNNGSSRDLSLF